MQLSIRDASRFVIGAGSMRDRAIAASGNPAISLENVAQAALREGPDGQKIRQTIDTLGERESAWLRNTPPHTLSSDRVMKSRSAEATALRAIHRAIISSVAFEAAATGAKPEAQDSLRQSLTNALEAIDQTPGSRADREGLLANMRDQLLGVASDGNHMKQLLHHSEQAYLAAELEKTFARYTNPSLSRSEDLDGHNL
ncbi:hypothetical protein I5S53_04765 [Pseudomonas juntendi]|nr:hypothetical protein [Pseudomonas juntendi]PYC07981.1 hypothetical protein DMX12_04950 [Pseudomonas sp. MB-090624]